MSTVTSFNPTPNNNNSLEDGKAGVRVLYTVRMLQDCTQGLQSLVADAVVGETTTK
jgi:hypothetical protein